MKGLAAFLTALFAFQCSLPTRTIANQGPPSATQQSNLVSLAPSQAPLSTAELQKKLRSELNGYIKYLWAIGYTFVTADFYGYPKGSNPNPGLTLVDRLPKTYKDGWFLINLSKCTTGTYLDGKLTVLKNFASIPGNVLKLYTELGVLDFWRTTASASTVAVQSALVDYLPRSYLNIAPEPSSADWRPFLQPSALTDDLILQKELEKRSTAFGNLLWLVRGQVGPMTMDKAVYKAWLDSEFDRRCPHFETAFSRRLIKALGPKGEQARKVLTAHGIEGLRSAPRRSFKKNPPRT